MSQFMKDLKAGFHPPLSLEGAELDESTRVTASDLQDVQDARDDIAETTDVLSEVTNDVDTLQQTVTALEAVSTAALDSVVAEPVEVEAVATVGNVAIQNTSMLLDEAIPQVEITPEGSVDQASMEGLGDWLGRAGKAIGKSVGALFDRISTGLHRLSVCVKGLTSRIDRIKNKAKARKGEGGKSIKVARNDLKLLVMGSSLSKDISGDVGTFVSYCHEITAIFGEYQQRLDTKIKTLLLQHLTGGVDKGAWYIPYDDLVVKMKEVIARQPELFIGNKVFEFTPQSTMRVSDILRVKLVDGKPNGKTVAEHLDMPLSYTREELSHELITLTEVVNSKLNEVEKLIDISNDNATNVDKALERLLTPPPVADASMQESIAVANANVNLTRIQNELIFELIAVVDAQSAVWLSAVAAVDAALAMSEATVFQD